MQLLMHHFKMGPTKQISFLALAACFASNCCDVQAISLKENPPLNFLEEGVTDPKKVPLLGVPTKKSPIHEIVYKIAEKIQEEFNKHPCCKSLRELKKNFIRDIFGHSSKSEIQQKCHAWRFQQNASNFEPSSQSTKIFISSEGHTYNCCHVGLVFVYFLPSVEK